MRTSHRDTAIARDARIAWARKYLAPYDRASYIFELNQIGVTPAQADERDAQLAGASIEYRLAVADRANRIEIARSTGAGERKR